MTALAAPSAPLVAGGSAWAIGAPRLLAGLDAAACLDLDGHLRTHGPRPDADLARLLALLDGIGGLAGRGGAGFPFSAKLRALTGGRARAVVVNGCESEPASGKDRLLLHRTPHLVLDGALAVAAALGARDVVVAVHDPSTAAAAVAACGQRRDARRVRVRTLAGGFVAGEARAVALASGRVRHAGPVLPPGDRTPPTAHGRLVANVETFAQLAVLLRLGSQRYAATGTPDEPGTTLLTVGGAVARPGVVEIPLGAPLDIVLSAARADDTRSVVLGGYHGSWIAPATNLRLSRASAAAAGGTLGAGVVLAVDGATCALGELARVTAWLAGESAGQCGPCRFGMPALAADVAALGAGAPAAGAVFAHAGAITGRGACAHPDGSARFVTSAVALLRDEIIAHAHGGCGRPVLGRLPVGGAR